MKFIAKLLDGDNKTIDTREVDAADWYAAREQATKFQRPPAVNGNLYPWHADPMNRNIRVTPA